MFEMLDTWLVQPSCSLNLNDEASASGYCWQFVLSNELDQMKFQTVMNRDTEWLWLGADNFLPSDSVSWDFRFLFVEDLVQSWQVESISPIWGMFFSLYQLVSSGFKRMCF